MNKGPHHYSCRSELQLVAMPRVARMVGMIFYRAEKEFGNGLRKDVHGIDGEVTLEKRDRTGLDWFSSIFITGGEDI